MSPVEAVTAPGSGVWRVARAPDPLEIRGPLPPAALDNPSTGNRFDSPTGDYGVLYFSTTLEGCFGETLARFRPSVELVSLISDEWRERGFMPPGEVAADWRQKRLTVRVRFKEGQLFPRGVRFLDVESPETREVLRTELADLLAYFGYRDLDVATVRAQDRRITRWISRWAFDARDEDDYPSYAGIRYLSRLDSKWECWAVFDDVEVEELSRRSILPGDDDLCRVAKRYGLHVF